MERRAACLACHAVQFGQKLGVIGRIITVRAGIAGREDARRAGQIIHCQARVVGDRRQAGGVGRMTGLDQGIVDKGDASFLGIVHVELGLGDRLDIQRGQQRGQLGDLAGVSRGHHPLRAHGVSASAAR